VSTTSNLITLIVVAGAGAVALAILKAKLRAGGGDEARFKAKPLLTANELEFLGRLEAAAPELRFFAQVAMGAMLEPAVPRSDRRGYYRLRGMFSQKIVDFVAQGRADGSVVAVIELDDRTHNPDKDARRDAMLQSAGYRIVRWNSKAKPDAAAIRAALLPPPPAAPATPHHGARAASKSSPLRSV
jgi:very-short-patch-repair endonuclease